MAKKILLVFILCGINKVGWGKCEWSAFVKVYNSGVQIESYNKYASGSYTVNITAGDSLTFHLLANNACTPSLTFIHNSDTLSILWGCESFDSTVLDAGYYHIDYLNFHLDLFVNYYVSTGTENQIARTSLKIYPTISTGIFKIKSSSTDLKQLRIHDSAGRIVFFVANNFSEIDLSNFSPGIYFYAVTDEKENIFRGRIVKE